MTALVIVTAVALLLGIGLYFLIRKKMTPTPPPSKVKTCVESALPDQVTGKIYQLGCGWGALAFRLAALHPRAEVRAYEVSPIPWLIAYLRFTLYPRRNLRLFWEDIFRISLEDASVVVCYLYPGAMERLKTKFEKELKPGTLVVSNSFMIPGWEPVETLRVNDFYRTKVFVYRV